MKALLALVLFAFALGASAAEDWPEIKWEELIPSHWNPRAVFKGMNLDLSKLQDSDPRAMDALDKLKVAWENAPTEPALNGKRVRIAGFAIPLERKGDKVTEFLLLPYFGACIHSPPPPANQIIVAASARPLAAIRSMDAVWAYGTLTAERRATDWGSAGYRLAVDKVTRYEEKPRR